MLANLHINKLVCAQIKFMQEAQIFSFEHSRKTTQFGPTQVRYIYIFKKLGFWNSFSFFYKFLIILTEVSGEPKIITHTHTGFTQLQNETTQKKYTHIWIFVFDWRKIKALVWLFENKIKPKRLILQYV